MNELADTYMGLFSKDLLENPYPTYAQFQLERPIYFDDVQGAWILTRFDDIMKVLKDPVTFSSARPLSSCPASLGHYFSLFCQDPPEHSRLRALVSRFFTTGTIEKLSPWIERKVDLLIGQLNVSNFDIAAELATPLPIAVIQKILGVEDQNWTKLKHLTELTVGHNAREVIGQSGRKAFLALHAMFKDYIRQKREHADASILTQLVTCELENSQLTDFEIINFCITLLVAGNETTANAIANMINILAQDPLLWQELKQDRSLIESAVTESLRFDSPVQFVSRKISSPISFGKTRLNKGDFIIACIGAANRDPNIYAFPHKFLPDRSEKQNLAFSHGIHYCIGASLTRIESKIVINKLLDKFKTIRLSEPGTRYANLFFRGFRHLRIEAT